MGLREATRATIYTKDTVHRPPSHMTLMGKVLYMNERPNKAGSQIPGDPACKTSAVGAVR
jgi:phosphoribosyl 1,2-cyclic phosphodiesterase